MMDKWNYYMVNGRVIAYRTKHDLVIREDVIAEIKAEVTRKLEDK